MFKKDKENQDKKEKFEFKHDEDDSDQSLQNKLTVARQILKNVQSNIEQLSSLLGDESMVGGRSLITTSEISELAEPDGRVIEGVFDGQNMIGSDGKQYTVPSNYASKSKLVEGDILKLTISGAGGFVYKQIGPIERTRIIGTLALDEDTQEYYVVSDTKKHKVLPASITYYRGEPGDEVVILVPKNSESNWAAVENIIRNEQE